MSKPPQSPRVCASTRVRPTNESTLRPRLLCLALFLAFGTHCAPSFDDDLSQVREPRIVAIVTTPAEGREGASASAAAFVVAPVAAQPSAPTYQLCLARKPLTELGSVNRDCLVAGGAEPDAVRALGQGASVSLTVPNDACQRFGPRRPDPKPGEPAGRPVDPDATGGFYLPLLAWLAPSAPVLGALRLTCGLTAADQSDQQEFSARYRANQNPELVALELERSDGSFSALDEDPETAVEVGASEALTLRAVWPACPRQSECGDGICGANEDTLSCSIDCKDPRGCGGAESYAYYDPSTLSVVERREGIVVAWYATAGKLAFEKSGRTEQDPDGVDTLVGYTAPGASGLVALWAVIRDDRGGTGVRRAVLRVR